ncbi:MAG: sulfite exporter TauE/SafE family protein [Acidimicrobiales bacterium]
MDPGLLRDILTVLAGFATGLLSGMFGVGGAVISTPAIRLLGAGALTAVGTTLPSIIPGAATGAARYRREGLINRSAVAITAPVGVAAAWLGAELAPRVPGEGHLLQLATAALLGVSATRMITSRRAVQDPAELVDPVRPATPPAHPRGIMAAIGFTAGLFSGLLGIGGGVLMVPAFTHFAGLRMKEAIGTSLVCVGLFAIPGTIAHSLNGTIDWRFALLLAVGVVPGARVGSALTIKASDERVRLTVGVFLAVTAVLYGAGELISLLNR